MKWVEFNAPPDTIQVISEAVDPREGLWCVFTVKNVPLRNFLTYMAVSACKFSHKRTCLYTTCPTISYVWARPTCFQRSVSNTRRVHARVHTLKDRCLLTFWVTKSFLCVTLNIWHHLVTKFSIDKANRCTTAWLNLWTLLSMQFFTYKVLSENSGLTHAKDSDACSRENS